MFNNFQLNVIFTIIKNDVLEILVCISPSSFIEILPILADKIENSCDLSLTTNLNLLHMVLKIVKFLDCSVQ